MNEDKDGEWVVARTGDKSWKMKTPSKHKPHTTNADGWGQSAGYPHIWTKYPKGTEYSGISVVYFSEGRARENREIGLLERDTPGYYYTLTDISEPYYGPVDSFETACLCADYLYYSKEGATT